MALSYVRTLDLTVNSVSVLFNDDIDTDISIENVSITCEIDSVNNPNVRSVSVENEVVDVTFDPLFSGVKYKITFLSTNDQSFGTASGEIIVEDGHRNSFFIVSPGEENEIRDTMFEDVTTIYETSEPTLVRDLISDTATTLQNVSDVIKTTAAANYISILQEDELKVRGDGPTDAFDNGGVYEVLRVASGPTLFNRSTELGFNQTRANTFVIRSNMEINSIISSVPSDPISLQSIDVVAENISNDTSEPNYFQGLRIKVLNKPVIQVISVSLKRDGEYIEYDIERFGYILKSNRYDTETCGTNVNFATDEIELSHSSIESDFVMPRPGDILYVSYVYKRSGRNVDGDTIVFSTTRTSTRETIDPLVTSFTLNHSPVVDESNQIPSLGGVVFFNTSPYSSNPALSTDHPAFTREIAYDLSRLPSAVGEFSINYETGEVYVYGEDTTNSGTGSSAPVATYRYRDDFVSGLDYTFDGDIDEVSVSSTRNVAGIEARLYFEYEDVFSSGEDFEILSHIESLNERVGNKLVDDFQIRTNNFPVTNVFRIFNETTGEIYSPERFNDSTITFSGRIAPRQKDVTRETAKFSVISQETLFITDDLTNTIGLRIIKINLANEGIINGSDNFIGANFNTSVVFTEPTVFIREFFYEDKLFQSVSTNLDRLSDIGDYCIDYVNGIVYVAVSTDQDEDVGDIKYSHKNIVTRNGKILSVYDIYKSINSSLPNAHTYSVGDISETEVEVVGLEQVGERFINGSTNRPIIVGTYQSGEDGITTNGGSVFTANTAVFNSDDIGRYLLVGTSSNPPSQEVQITGIVNTHEVTVSPAFNYTDKGRPWVVLDLSFGAAKTITLEHNIFSVRNIYTVTQLGTLPYSELDGYFDIDRDSISGNVITLGATNPLNVGDAVIVDYSPGRVFVDYRYLQDEVLVSYEYGKNSLDWSSNTELSTGDEYYVTYRYGALRESLLSNFGSLTQIPQLTNFSPNLNREVYRSILGGTLQSFIEGPTVRSIERLVESFTGVTPDITESAFSNWVLGRDNLHLRNPEYSSNQDFDLGKFGNGILLEDGNNVKIAAVSHFRLKEGTLETWIRPKWNGIGNDSDLTFDLYIDGYADVSKIFIGVSGANPDSVPFTINRDTSDFIVSGEPANLETGEGFFIWLDTFNNRWNIRWGGNVSENTAFTGTITTDGEMYNVARALDDSGFYINEVSDFITSTTDSVEFSGHIDGYDAAVAVGSISRDGFYFSSDKIHFIFDMAEYAESNRVSLFKDGTGYLNFQVFDNQHKYGNSAGFYNISKSVADWEADTLHHVAIAWKFNSIDETDEMHLFVDGEEVPNLFKYGGNPKANSSFKFGSVAQETVINGSSRAIVGSNDGFTTSGSTVFASASSDFSASGVKVGDPFYLLDDTPDGTGDPNFGSPYYVTGVGTTSITLDRAPTLTLGLVNFSCGMTTATITTPVNIQDFVIVTVDSNGNETELNGIGSSLPDYSIRRGENYSHVLTILNGVSITDVVLAKTLGLILKRCRGTVYSYGSVDELKTYSAQPVSLNDVDITAVILEGVQVELGDDFGIVGTTIGAQLVSLLQSSFTSVCQPSNQTAGRRLSVSLSGDNIDYGVSGNYATINGTTYSGATEEIVHFSDNGTQETTEYWTSISSISLSVIPLDLSQPVASFVVREYKPINESENNGDYAEVAEFYNGTFRLETYGTGGDPFVLNACSYEYDYPSYLRIRIDGQPDDFYIGTDFNGNHSVDAVLDEFRILDYMSEDTRIGETLAIGETSITTDYNELTEFTKNNNTLLLLHFDDSVEDDSDFIDRFNAGFEVTSSVNDSFDEAIKIASNKPYLVTQDKIIFTPNEGTIEFWVSPINDTKEDPNFHYYLDMSSVVEETVDSSSALVVVASQKIREVESVRLSADTYNTGIDYFEGGSVSNIDGKTITLGIRLPAENISVKITYVPVSSQGDRVSIYKDSGNRINFFVKASGIEHLVSTPISWEQHTWHRVMVMWQMNTLNNTDRLRLFIDGSETGTIKYGTGLIYGTGVIYGQAEIRPDTNRFLVSNIDFTDTMSRIFIGTDIYSGNGAKAALDNFRFSNAQRLSLIRTTSSEVIDTGYVSNLSLSSPSVEDSFTTAVFNFDNVYSKVDFVVTLINQESGIFTFKVDVIDSFDRIKNDQYLQDLLVELINVIKPAHSIAVIEFIE